MKVDVSVGMASEQGGITTARHAPELETVVYRLVQEALTNAAKHWCAERTAVEVQESDGVVHVSVRDDGEGSGGPTCGPGSNLGSNVRATQAHSGTRDPSKHGGEPPRATRSLGLGAGRSQVQILSPRYTAGCPHGASGGCSGRQNLTPEQAFLCRIAPRCGQRRSGGFSTGPHTNPDTRPRSTAHGTVVQRNVRVMSVRRSSSRSATRAHLYRAAGRSAGWRERDPVERGIAVQARTGEAVVRLA